MFRWETAFSEDAFKDALFGGAAGPGKPIRETDLVRFFEACRRVAWVRRPRRFAFMSTAPAPSHPSFCTLTFVGLRGT